MKPSNRDVEIRSAMRQGQASAADADGAPADPAGPAGSASQESGIAQLAAAIGEPARARMLCCLLDGHARTATELGVIGGTGASTASGHLARLVDQGLLSVLAQGRHRYFRLAGANVAGALEALMVVAGTSRVAFTPATPENMRLARTCYDHLAGELAVGLHDAFLAKGWLAALPDGYAITGAGEAALVRLGIDMAAVRASRRRLACPCMDWSERRPHLGGAAGAALLKLARTRGWVQDELDSRALKVTRTGLAELRKLAG